MIFLTGWLLTALYNDVSLSNGSDLNIENEIGNIIRFSVWRIPKTNHEALMRA